MAPHDCFSACSVVGLETCDNRTMLVNHGSLPANRDGKPAGDGAQNFAVFAPDIENLPVRMHIGHQPVKARIQLVVFGKIGELESLDLVFGFLQLLDVIVGNDLNEAAREVRLDKQLDLVGVAQEVFIDGTYPRAAVRRDNDEPFAPQLLKSCLSLATPPFERLPPGEVDCTVWVDPAAVGHVVDTIL